MQIVMLVGGLATRMQPVSETLPKSMVPVAGKPMLWYQLELFKQMGVTDIILCVGHLKEKIMDHFGDGSGFGVRIRYSVEEELLGTAGAVGNIPRGWLDKRFVVYYGDIISTIDCSRMMLYHSRMGAQATVHVHKKDSVGSSVIDFDDAGRIHEFVEKPTPAIIEAYKSRGKPNWVNSGIYVLDRGVLSLVPEHVKFDFAAQLFPLLLSKRMLMCAYPLEEGECWREVGTIERYTEFEREIQTTDLLKTLNINS